MSNANITNLAVSASNNNKPSPAKTAKGGGAHEHGNRKHPPQSSRGAGAQNQSPSPVPLSYNVPDHFSHLVPLLPHPTPQGVAVPIRVEIVHTSHTNDGDDNGDDEEVVQTRIIAQTEKGVKVRWPPKRTTIGEMRRRVRAMMEYVARAQLDAGERERRVEMLKAAAAEAKAEANSALLMGTSETVVLPPEESDEKVVRIQIEGGDPDATEAAPSLVPADLAMQDGQPTMGEEVIASLGGDGDVEMAVAGEGSDPPPAGLKTEEVVEAALAPDTATNGDSNAANSSVAPTPSAATKGVSPSPPLSSSSKPKPKISTSSLIDDSRVAPSALFASPPTGTTSASAPTSALRTPIAQFSSNSSTTTSATSPSVPTTTQLLDELTRELIQFQERFGAGREGKVYTASRVEARERRSRAAPAMAVGGAEADMF